ncbi:MAG: hypothetical protein K2N35_16470, partial [Muribaculaceae bacterium]|nr:hypothetical protein [Muribaculaceae bacterium]
LIKRIFGLTLLCKFFNSQISLNNFNIYGNDLVIVSEEEVKNFDNAAYNIDLLCSKSGRKNTN